jgi:hypothetical protein
MKIQPDATTILATTMLMMTGQTVLAGDADVIDIDVTCKGRETCSFSVTIKHDDTGWDHYANGWEIIDSSGNVIAVRELTHPHVNEQPFTRSLDSVSMPAEIDQVTIRASDSVHGNEGKHLIVDLPR